MPVHAQSVFSLNIQQYDPVLYTLLTDRENYCYITPDTVNIIAPDTGFSIYSPEFILLNTEILNYLNIPRSELVKDLFSNTYGYKTMNIMYATDGSQLPLIKPNALFSMNGYSASLSATPISYYFDYTKGALPADPGTFISIPLDTATILAADPAELIKIEAIQMSMTSTVKSIAIRLMLEDLPTTGLSMSKQEFGQWFFGSGPNDLGWKAADGVYSLGFTIPSYVV